MATMVQDPGWDGVDRPRVLIEAAEWRHRHVLSRLLQGRGYATATCPGPEGTDERCPLAAGDRCRAVSEADVVIHTLRPTDVRNREVLLALQHQQPPVRVIAEVTEAAVEARRDDYASCAVVPADPRSVVDALEGLGNPGSERGARGQRRETLLDLGGPPGRVGLIPGKADGGRDPLEH